MFGGRLVLSCPILEKPAARKQLALKLAVHSLEQKRRDLAAAVHTWRMSARKLLIRAHIEARVDCPACSHQDCKKKSR